MNSFLGIPCQARGNSSFESQKGLRTVDIGAAISVAVLGELFNCDLCCAQAPRADLANPSEPTHLIPNLDVCALVLDVRLLDQQCRAGFPRP